MHWKLFWNLPQKYWCAFWYHRNIILLTVFMKDNHINTFNGNLFHVEIPVHFHSRVEMQVKFAVRRCLHVAFAPRFCRGNAIYLRGLEAASHASCAPAHMRWQATYPYIGHIVQYNVLGIVVQYPTRLLVQYPTNFNFDDDWRKSKRHGVNLKEKVCTEKTRNYGSCTAASKYTNTTSTLSNFSFQCDWIVCLCVRLVFRIFRNTSDILEGNRCKSLSMLWRGEFA